MDAGVRLRHRRRRHRRLPAREPAERRSGGAGAAARGRRVDAYHWIRIPVGYLYCIGNPRTDWMYLTEPEPGLNGRRLRYPRGRVLGGCSSINGMIYMRGQARDYDGWAELTRRPRLVLGERAAGLRRAREPLADGRRRRPGVRAVPRRRRRAPGREAAAALGHPRRLRRGLRRGRHPGARGFQRRRQRGRRLFRGQPARRLPLERRPGLPAAGVRPAEPAVRTGAEVGAAGAASARDGGPRLHRRRAARAASASAARRAVVLAAGAVNSPKLLQLSGLGPAALLAGHGVEVAPTCRRWAATCRTTCRSARLQGDGGARTLNELAARLARQGADRARVCAAADRADEHGARASSGRSPGRVRAGTTPTSSSTCSR